MGVRTANVKDAEIGATIERLAEIIASRHDASPESSYTARLLQGEEDSLLKKIAEEASEVIMAAKDDDHDHLRYESADLIYHLLVVLDKHGRYEARNLKKLEETEPNEPKENKPMVKSTYIDPALKTAIAVGMAEQSQDYDFEDVLEDDDFNETYKDYLDDEDLHKERKRK